MSENRQIARAAGLVGFFTLISRFAGLVRDSVVGYYFGNVLQYIPDNLKFAAGLAVIVAFFFGVRALSIRLAKTDW